VPLDGILTDRQYYFIVDSSGTCSHPFSLSISLFFFNNLR
jgi:hypothetical protein